MKGILIGLFFVNVLLANDSVFCLPDCVLIDSSGILISSKEERPYPLTFRWKKKISPQKRWVAAALAFPFPFGIVGLHRIYMGTAPHVPVVYIASFGGAFGVLPFIDFCILLLDKKYERYFNNPRLFMWIEPGMNNTVPSGGSFSP